MIRQIAGDTRIGDPEAGLRRTGKYIGRRTAAQEIHDHLRGHVAWPGRYTLGNHAVIASEYDQVRGFGGGRIGVLSHRHLPCQRLDLAKRARWLCLDIDLGLDTIAEGGVGHGDRQITQHRGHPAPEYARRNGLSRPAAIA